MNTDANRGVVLYLLCAAKIFLRGKRFNFPIFTKKSLSNEFNVVLHKHYANQ